MNDGLSREDAHCRSKQVVGVNQTSNRLMLIWLPSVVGIVLDLKHSHLSQIMLL